MNKFKNFVLLTFCLFCLAIFTSACGGSGKPTPPDNSSALYYLLALQNNQQEENNQQQNNNQQEENNQKEEQVATTEVTLTLTDSLNDDKIAKADIFYTVDDNTKKTSVDDKEILKATPNADDNTKFTVTAIGTKAPAKVKIKAILTYDSEENLLDYFSSYKGIEGTDGNFNIDFENSKDIDGFGGGNGGPDSPYLISKPRHFININAKDNSGYLYLDCSFKQTEDLDFTHLTGLKINNANLQKKDGESGENTIIETVNKKAPFYNEGHGIKAIGEIDNTTTDTNEQFLNTFKGKYYGENHIIDGIIQYNDDIIQSEETFSAGLFSGIYQGEIINIIIGENSIFFFDKLPKEKENQHNNKLNYFYLGSITGHLANSKLLKCENRATLLLSNIKIDQDIMSEIKIGGLAGTCSQEITIKETTNAGNIIINNCTFGKAKIWLDPMCYLLNSVAHKNINKGHINITNNKFSTYDLYILPQENNYTNTGHINITDNSNNGQSTIYATNITNMDVSNFVAPYENPVCNNSGHITITTGENVTIYLAKNIYLENNISYEDCTNTGTVTVNGKKREISPVKPEEF